MCPPGTSMEGCFLNKLAWYMTLQQPSSTDSRTIGKRSLPAISAGVGSDMYGLDLKDIAQMLEYLSQPDEGIGDTSNDVFNPTFADLYDSFDGSELQINPFSDSLSTELERDDDMDMENTGDDYFDYLINSLNTPSADDQSLIPLTNKRGFLKRNSKDKRQFSCKGDTYSCFLKNLQYVLEIQKTMHNA